MIDGRGAKLDAFEAERGDVLDRLDVVAAPGNRGVADGDLRGGAKRRRRGRRGAGGENELTSGRGCHGPRFPEQSGTASGNGH